MTVRIAFAGTGHISRVHAAAAASIDGVEGAAVVNHRAASAQEFAERFRLPRRHERISQLIEAGGVDALVVSTPNYLHAPQAIAALEAGIHVLVEKPMAMNAAQAQAMKTASQASGAKLMVGHCWRFDEEMLWLQRQIEAGRLGKILRSKGYAVHVNWGPGGWFADARYAGGGALADMGIHAIDASRFLLGDPMPASVYARIATHHGDYDVDDSGTIWINWDNGAMTVVESGWWWPHADGPEACTQVYGSAGWGQVFPTRLERPDRAAETVEVIDPGFPHPRADHCPQVMYDAQMAHFIDCIGRDIAPLPGGDEGLINMRIVDAALESSRCGQLVSLS